MDLAAVEALLEIRDSIGLAKNLIVGIYMAAQAPTVSGSERAALCSMSDVTRERLEAAERSLDILIAYERARSS